MVDYSTDFRTIATECKWNSSFYSAFYNGLSDVIKDELVARIPPMDQDALIVLAIHSVSVFIDYSTDGSFLDIVLASWVLSGPLTKPVPSMAVCFALSPIAQSPSDWLCQVTTMNHSPFTWQMAGLNSTVPT